MAEMIKIKVDPDLAELVPEYFADRQRELLDMITLLESLEFSRLCSIAHQLKGTGESYGFTKLSEIGGALEQSAKASNAAAAQEQLGQLREYYSLIQLVH
jgi:HPt (histidine-containing phosphotransfer) domain-containing protein